MGATCSRIFLQVSGSSSTILSVVIGGNEHKRHGSPTQRHPLHDACTKVANEHKKILDTSKINTRIKLTSFSFTKYSPKLKSKNNALDFFFLNFCGNYFNILR